VFVEGGRRLGIGDVERELVAGPEARWNVRRTDGWIEVATGVLRLYFVRDPVPTHDRVIPSFDVTDRDAAVRHLQGAGCTLVPIGPHSPDGHYLRDPSGVVFDVIQRDATD